MDSIISKDIRFYYVDSSTIYNNAEKVDNYIYFVKQYGICIGNEKIAPYLTKVSELQNDSDFATVTLVNTKVDKVEGKQLSTEDYTTPEKEKLESLYNYDDSSLINFIQNLPAYNISDASINDWNQKTNNVGTITGISMNNTSMGNAGEVNLGNVITSIKTINGNDITGNGNIDISGLPVVTTTDNDKILMVVNGEWQMVTPVFVYSGTTPPSNVLGRNGDIYLEQT